jgi:nucleoside-diphosphate-sugar epimerase
VPITESTPVAPNPALEYAQAKLRAEDALLGARRATGFPVTIVRPSHTYDDANPPLPGGWTVIDRMLRGEEIPVHGDGTSLWTVTHAEDFAQGLVGLLGNPKALGEVYNITGADVYTWDQIYAITAAAFGVQARLVHVASEMFPVVAPEWFWSGEMVGDIGHSAIFDTTKIRTAVPGFSPRLTYSRSVARMAEWRRTHPDSTGAERSTDEVLSRIVAGYHAATAAFAALAPVGS